MHSETPYQDMYEEGLRVRSPLFPLYSTVRAALQVWDGYKRTDVYRMIQDILAFSGTPQDTTDWSDPDHWIKDRLNGTSQEIAMQTWKQSQGALNPRHSYGTYMVINKYNLMDESKDGTYALSSYGQSFLDDDQGLIKHIDELEGINGLLAIITSEQPAKRGKLLPRWEDYLSGRSKYGTKSTLNDTLGRRLNNLLDRGLISRDGGLYSVTASGAKVSGISHKNDNQPKKALLKSISAYNESQKKAFLDHLMQIHPYMFEKLISQLLEAMDYQDVVVTKQSGDKGVDVIAKAQFGITEITELVQVKRTRSTIIRPVLDQLRGAAQLYDGIFKATIITLGSFAKGCKEAATHPKALPVTLIDGDKLFELMVENEIGIKGHPAYILELDDQFLDALRDKTNLAA